MKWFYDLKIGAKLLVGFLIIVLMSGIIGVIGIANIRSIDSSYTLAYKNNTVPLDYLDKVAVSFQRTRVYLLYVMLDTKNSKKYLDSIDEYEKMIDKNLVEFEKIISSDALRTQYDNLKVMLNNYIELRKSVIDLALAGKQEQALEFTTSNMTQKGIDIDNAINEIYASNIKQAKGTSEKNNAATNTTVYVMIAIILGMTGVAIALGIFISRIISNPIKKLVQSAEKIAQGDVTVEVKSTTKDEMGSLMESFAKMTESIRNLVSEANMLTKEAIEGKLDTRGNAGQFSGSYKEIINGVNKTLDTLVGHINAMPAPVMIIDKDYSIQYMNQFGSDLVGIPQKQLVGTKCYNHFKTSDCNTLNCACNIAMSQGRNTTKETDAHPKGMNLEISYTAIPTKDDNGKVIGCLELVTDQTFIKNAARVVKKQADYQVKEVEKLEVCLGKLAKGDLRIETSIAPTDEDTKTIGEIFLRVNKSLEECTISLNEALSQIDSSASQVAAGSNQVSMSAQALSQGSTEQASAIEEITSSMTQVAVQTKQNALNANQANELAITAKGNAVSGNDQMKEMLKAMQEINDSSENISKIIKVIDEIAFQTNILALNAAVEAARAGQHGKGFAVVAEEVRNLAARSANAAKETTNMIEGSIKKAEVGTKIASETAQALNKIVDNVAKAAELVGGIAIASNEQATGIAQVNTAIEQVAQVVQTNSATAEESAAASEELSGQAQLLKEAVGRFRLKKLTNSQLINNGEYSPEMLKAIERMIEKKNSQSLSFDIKTDGDDSYAQEPTTVTKSKKPKISLSDKEFGKY